jgi:cobalt-zinc-cadmium efflux system protein
MPSDRHAHHGHHEKSESGRVTSHWHHEDHLAHEHLQSLKRITFAFYLNLGFALIEFIGGLLTGSLAILADALHDLGDAVTLGIARSLQKFSGRQADSRYSYGYRRFSLLSAMLTGVMLLVVSIFIFIQTIVRLREPHEVHGLGMLGLAVFGVIMNSLAAFGLRKGHSHNERMLSWHLLEDVLGWVAVLIGSLFVIFKGWTWVDPLLAMGLCVFVVFNVFRNLRSTVEVLLQKVPDGLSLEELNEQFKKIPGLIDVHDLHVWSLDGQQNIMSLHAVISDAALAHQVKHSIGEIVSKYGHFHTTIETELSGDHCDENPKQQHKH